MRTVRQPVPGVEIVNFEDDDPERCFAIRLNGADGWHYYNKEQARAIYHAVIRAAQDLDLT